MMKSSCFAQPCCELVTPLLVELGECYPCRQWEAACKLLRISRFWNAVVAEWSQLVTEIALDERVDKAALLKIAAACNRLRRLTLRSCGADMHSMYEGLTAIATANDLLALNLPRCCNLSLYDCLLQSSNSKYANYSSLQVLDLTGICLSNRDLLVIMARLKQLGTLILEGSSFTTSWCSLALLIEEKRETLKVLNVSGATTQYPSQPFIKAAKAAWELFTAALTKCRMLRELQMRGLPLVDEELTVILMACRTTIEVLDLSETLITKLSLTGVAELPAIKRLCVQGCPGVPTLDECSFVVSIWPQLAEKLRRGWARLDFHRARPDDPSVTWYGPQETSIPIYGLNFTVGRSRSNCLRIGENWTNHLYVSSEHMIVYPWFVWDRKNKELNKELIEPIIEPWVVDKSQNGTFLNKKAVGYNQRAPLQNGVQLEVFSRVFFRNHLSIDVPDCRFYTL